MLHRSVRSRGLFIPALTRGLKAVYLPASAHGTVDSLFGSTVVLRGPPQARSGGLIRFPVSGALGTVTSLATNGTLVVSLLSGPRPARGESGFPLPAPLATTLRPLDALGRVLDPFGGALDGGPALGLGGEAAAWFAPAPGPGDDARAPRTALLPTHAPALDAFTPLLRGGSLALLADAGGAAASASAFLRGLGGAARVEGDAVVVLTLGGRSKAGLAAAVAGLAGRGDMAHTVVLASPSDGGWHPAAAALLPLAGVAVAEAFARLGCHALVLHDDLAGAVGADGGGDFTHFQTGLWDRCVQLPHARGGGSVSAVGLLVLPRRGAAHASPAGERVRGVCANLGSLADERVVWGAGDWVAPTRGGWDRLPLPSSALGVTPGHASQGPMLRWLTERARVALAEAKEAGAAVVAAAGYGVPAEANSDVLMRVLEVGTQLLQRAPAAGAPPPQQPGTASSAAGVAASPDADARRAALLAKLDPAQRAALAARRGGAPAPAHPGAAPPAPTPSPHTSTPVESCPLPRTALTLFLVSSGYGVTVPPAHLARWEAGLWDCLSALPAPPEWVVGEGGSGSLLDAVLACAPPPTARVCLEATLRATTHRLLARVPREEEALPLSSSMELGAQAVGTGAQGRFLSFSMLSPLFRPRMVPAPPLAPAAPPAPAPAPSPASPWGAMVNVGLDAHLCLDPGMDCEGGWEALPAPLRALHVACAGFTARFVEALQVAAT